MTPNTPVISVTITGATTEQVKDALLALAATLGGDRINTVALASDATGAEAKVDVGPGTNKTPPIETTVAPVSDHVSELSPKQAREQGIQLMTDFHVKNPTGLTQITTLAGQYGVTKFADIPDDKAHAFLADARLIASDCQPA